MLIGSNFVKHLKPELFKFLDC